MTKHLLNSTLVFSLAFGLTFLATQPSSATQGSIINIHDQYQSLRALGMGGAFSAVANDYSAWYYNPAGYSRITEGQMLLSPLEFTISDSFSAFQTSMGNVSGTGASNVSNITTVMNSLSSNQYQVRIKLLEMAWARPNWGVAFIPADFTMDMAIHNLGAPSLEARVYADTTLAYGYGKHIKNESLGLLSYGLTTKLIMREYAAKSMNVIDVATNNSTVTSNDLTNGATADVDLGFLYTPYLPPGDLWDLVRSWHPTFSFVGRNLLDYGFGTQVLTKGFSTTDHPEKLYRAFDIGYKAEIPKFWIFGGRFALDERNIGHPYFNYKKDFHTGFEFDWAMTSWWKGQWRVGYGSNTWSAGFSALFTVFRLDLATYGEEYGSDKNPAQNRMYAIKLVGEL